MSCDSLLRGPRNADLQRTYAITSQGLPFDLTGWSALFNVYATPGATALLALSGSPDANQSSIIISSASAGLVTLIVTEADMEALPLGSPVTSPSALCYDLLLTNTDAKTTRFTFGQFIVDPVGGGAWCQDQGDQLSLDVGASAIQIDIFGGAPVIDGLTLTGADIGALAVANGAAPNMLIPTSGTIARALEDQLGDRLNIEALITGLSQTAATAALNAAAPGLIASGKTLWVPSWVNVLLNGSIICEGWLNLECDGTIITVGVNGPAFQFTLNSATTMYKVFRGKFVNQAVALAPYSNSAMLEILGDTSFCLDNEIDIKGEGFYDGLRVNKATISTSFGLESPFAYNMLSIDVRGGVNGAVNGLNFRQGSGTANHIRRISGFVQASGSFLRYGGAGCVIGDVSATAGELGADGGAAFNFMSIEASAAYLNDFDFSEVQFDAGTCTPINSDPTNAPLSNVKGLSNNVGGLTNDNIQPMLTSVWDGLNVSQWREGKNNALTPSTSASLQTVALFKVKLAAPWTCRVKVVINGLIGGVDGCCLEQDFVLTNLAGTTTVVAKTPDQTPGSFPANEFALTTSVTGDTTTLTLTYTPTSSANSYYDAQMQVIGGVFAAHAL